MTSELYALTFSLILAIVQVLLPAFGRTRQLGSAWNAGPRDEPLPPPNAVTGRLERAQKNLFETLPLFIGAVLIAHVAGKNGPVTEAGAWVYLIARIAYVPLYAFGVKYVRSLVFGFALAGLAMILAAVLFL